MSQNVCRRCQEVWITLSRFAFCSEGIWGICVYISENLKMSSIYCKINVVLVIYFCRTSKLFDHTIVVQ